MPTLLDRIATTDATLGTPAGASLADDIAGVPAAVAGQACGAVAGSIGKAASDAASDASTAKTQTTAANIGAAVWNALTATYAATGSFGKLLGTTWATLFAGITSLANWLRAGYRKSTPDATALSEINNGGGTFAASTDSLEGQGDRTQNYPYVVTPGAITGASGNPPAPTPLFAVQHRKLQATRAIVDESGDAINLSGKDVSLIAWLVDSPTSAAIVLKSYGTSPALTIAGADSNQLVIDAPGSTFTTAGDYRYLVTNETDDVPLHVTPGHLTVEAAPDNPA